MIHIPPRRTAVTGVPRHRSPRLLMRWQTVLVLMALLVVSGGASLLMPQHKAHAESTATPAQVAIQYADSHWNCTTPACTSTVPAGSSQPDFQCADFVAHSLAAAGLIPGLTPSSSDSAYLSYKAPNGKKYDLMWVGWNTGVGYSTGIDGLYQFLTQNGLATDIGEAPTSSISLADVVIYHEGQGHTAIIAQTGSAPLVDAHNNARYHVNYTEGYSDFTILHLTLNGVMPTPPPGNPGSPGAGSWPNVTIGSNGENVYSIQLMLAARGYSIGIDGQFGQQTQSTVEAFQSAHGLSADGGVGPQTWPVLIVQTQLNSSGPAVEALQRQLNKNGANLNVDGNFGPATQQAVQNFQSQQGLDVDGQAGPLTWQALVSHSSPTPPPPVQTSGSWPNMKEGSNGENVYSIQLLLEAHGYSLGVDGQFGSQTTSTVEAFQSAHGLSADGQVGSQTWPALIIQTQLNSTGYAVQALQRQLNAHGANVGVDGQFGPATQTAVRNYQSSHGLGVDGQAGPQTWLSLVSNTAPTSLGSWPNESENSSGEDIYSLQLFLLARGYTIGVDGQFGPQTKAVVEAFQAAHNLGVDGQVGPQTWPVLIIQTQLNSMGMAVEALQRQLNAHGANIGVDGQFGPDTDAALRSYQSAHGLEVDGQAGPQTWQSLLSTSGTVTVPPPPPPPSGSVLWGVDTSDNIVSSGDLSKVISTRGKPAFVGQYIDANSGVSILSSSEAASLHNQGIRIMVLDSSYTSNDTTYSTGVSMANRALSNIEALGIPKGVAVFSDIEASNSVDAGFIEGWYATISAAGYVSGYYENPYSGSGEFPSAFCSAISSNANIANDSILYSDEPENTGWTTESDAPGFGPANVYCNGHAAGRTEGWQYAQGGGGINVDSDEVNSSLPLW